MQDNDYRVVGKPVPRIDGKVKVTGTATFADDLFMPRMQAAEESLCACPH
jgi:CO/xanthine dehydrogenase Mo-binding subunit